MPPPAPPPPPIPPPPPPPPPTLQNPPNSSHSPAQHSTFVPFVSSTCQSPFIPQIQPKALAKVSNTPQSIYSPAAAESSTPADEEAAQAVHKSPSQLLQEEIRRFRNQNQRRRQNNNLPNSDNSAPAAQPTALSQESESKSLIILSQHQTRCQRHKNLAPNPTAGNNANKSFRLQRQVNVKSDKGPNAIDSMNQSGGGGGGGNGRYHQHHHHHNHQHGQSPAQSGQVQSQSQQNNNTSGGGGGGGAQAIDGTKKSRYILFSQIYLIVHVSITLCLAQYQSDAGQAVAQIVLTVYTLYILIVSMIFFMLLRFYASPSANGHGDSKFNELTEQSTILFGATLLGLSEILLSGVNVSNCIHTEFILVPICKLAFALFMIHFLLTQVIHSECIGIRNVAIAHILATQLSLFILSVIPGNPVGNESICVAAELRNISTTGENIVTPQPSEYQFILALLSNQFKLLTMFILLTIWFTNNQSKINFIRAKLSDEEMLRAQQGATANASSMLHDFLLCAPFFILTALTVTFEDRFRNLHSFTEIFIQILTAIVSTFGLLIRRRNKYLNPKYQINLLKHHHIILVSLCFTYVIAFVNVVSTSLQFISGGSSREQPMGSLHERSSDLLSLVNWIALLVQVTVQTYLLRLQGKKLVHMSRIFALLVVMNICLWMLNLYSVLTQSNQQVAVGETSASAGEPARTVKWSPAGGSGSGGGDLLDRLTHILSMFVTLNRFYCAMIFCHFWRMQQF